MKGLNNCCQQQEDRGHHPFQICRTVIVHTAHVEIHILEAQPVLPLASESQAKILVDVISPRSTKWMLTLAIRNRFFTKRVVRHWNRPPRERGLALSLQALKYLDNTLSGLIFEWFCMEPGVGLNDPYGSLPNQDILWFYVDPCSSSVSFWCIQYCTSWYWHPSSNW